ncbi:hypothetical protein R6Q59_021587 [Mikania micrantha]
MKTLNIKIFDLEAWKSVLFEDSFCLFNGYLILHLIRAKTKANLKGKATKELSEYELNKLSLIHDLSLSNRDRTEAIAKSQKRIEKFYEIEQVEMELERKKMEMKHKKMEMQEWKLPFIDTSYVIYF